MQASWSGPAWPGLRRDVAERPMSKDLNAKTPCGGRVNASLEHNNTHAAT